MISEQKRQELQESALHYDDKKYGDENSYLFSMVALKNELIKTIDYISGQAYEVEDARQKKLKPYQTRLEKVRAILDAQDLPPKKVKKRNRLPDPHTIAVANFLQEFPDYSADAIYYQIYECSKPENESIFGDRIYIEYCDHEYFEWCDANAANSKLRKLYRRSFDDLVYRAKEYSKK